MMSSLFETVPELRRWKRLTDAIGFHGTSKEVVPHLLARDIRPSDQRFEWLGTGIYLWQDSPWRARQWAEEPFGADAAMVVARVDLDGCLDLLNPMWQGELRDADFEFVFECITQSLPIPVNTESGNHARDAATINFYCDRVAADGVIRPVRAIFEEGEPIFEASKIRTCSHVQIAVRTSRPVVGTCGP